MAFTISGIGGYSGISFTTTQPSIIPPVYLQTWGLNSVGQLGVGDTTNRSSPVQVGSLTTWLNIAAGTYHNLAISN